MKKRYFIILVIIAIVLIFVVLSTKVNTCEELSMALDSEKQIDPARCDQYFAENQKPILVGGKLIDTSKLSTPWYGENRSEFTLTFKGFKKERRLRIATGEEAVPYEIGKFYRFDLGRECPLIHSMASSGNFLDSDLNALEHLEECS